MGTHFDELIYETIGVFLEPLDKMSLMYVCKTSRTAADPTLIRCLSLIAAEENVSKKIAISAMMQDIKFYERVKESFKAKHYSMFMIFKKMMMSKNYLVAGYIYKQDCSGRQRECYNEILSKLIRKGVPRDEELSKHFPKILTLEDFVPDFF